MSQHSGDQPLNFGSDLSCKACLKNCKDGECCDCDHHRPTNSTSGQAQSVGYQQLAAAESMHSLASSGQGPSQPPINVQQYQSMDPMYYGSFSPGEGGVPNYGGVHIAAPYPSGFTTQPSSYPDSSQGNPTYDSLGYFRDGAGNLFNGMGQPIDQWGRLLEDPGTPQVSPAAGSYSGGSFASAKTHRSHSGGSKASSSHSHKKHEETHKRILETGYDHAVASSSRTDAGSGLVSQQPPQHASMGYYDDDPADETESLLPQQDYGTIGDSGSSSSHGHKGKSKGKAKAKARHHSHNHDKQDRSHDEQDRSHDRSRR
ncbi:hypothetical protein Daus18300_013547 [Diaporthe australafricana]|uniref:Uncharacterized protein n=1 Tax=Diaporthe australafricana TaxID=127596 RepID=A0ABR3VYN0_9PEZI